MSKSKQEEVETVNIGDAVEAPRLGPKSKSIRRATKNPKTQQKQNIMQGLNVMGQELINIKKQLQQTADALGKLGQFVADRNKSWMETLPRVTEGPKVNLENAIKDGKYLHYFAQVWKDTTVEGEGDNAFVYLEFILDKWQWKDYDKEAHAGVFEHVDTKLTQSIPLNEGESLDDAWRRLHETLTKVNKPKAKAKKAPRKKAIKV
ncbi:MAG TPA: hypothetical protein DCY51_08335 [Bacteroidetes bacterium]|nr:hypothetical protein [Bacteroidota bacterium]